MVKKQTNNNETIEKQTKPTKMGPVFRDCLTTFAGITDNKCMTNHFCLHVSKTKRNQKQMADVSVRLDIHEINIMSKFRLVIRAGHRKSKGTIYKAVKVISSLVITSCSCHQF